MKRIFAGALTLFAGQAFTTGAMAGKSASAGPVQLTANVTIAAGAAENSVSAFRIPKGFYLEVKTVSFYRVGAASGTDGEVLVNNTFDNVSRFETFAQTTPGDVALPGGTLSATFYCDGGTVVDVNAYRTGSTSAQETDYITLSGVYVPVPAN